MQRETYRQVLEVVLARPFNLDIIAPMASLCGYLIAELIHPRLAFIDHFAAVSAGIRTDLDDVIRCGDDILVVLHDDNRVA